MSCAICEVRKEKRFCPAVHGRICPQCCGEQREVTLDCPSECVYLQQARQHERPRPIEELDTSELFPDVEIGKPFLYEREPLLVGLSFDLARSARADRSLNDRDLIAGLASLARSYYTLVNSGLHYQDSGPSLVQQHVSAGLRKMIAEYQEVEQKQRGYSTLRDSDVLRALVFLLRMAHGRTSGRPRSRAFIDLLFAQFPEKSSVLASAEESTGRIIAP